MEQIDDLHRLLKKHNERIKLLEEEIFVLKRLIERLVLKYTGPSPIRHPDSTDATHKFRYKTKVE
jgi:hypothetical protein